MIPVKEPTYRKQPTQRRSKGLVDAVIQAGNEVLNRPSEKSLSIGRIAERAGVSIGSIYQYFSSKEQVVGEMGNRKAQEHLSFFERKMEGLKELPLETAIDRAVEVICDLYLSNPTLLRNLFALGPQWRRIPAVKQARERAASRMVAHLKTLPPGTLRPKNPELTVFVLMNALFGTLEVAVIGDSHAFSVEELRAELVDLCRRYLFSE
jgi:AcrR family transcriptional regulator